MPHHYQRSIWACCSFSLHFAFAAAPGTWTNWPMIDFRDQRLRFDALLGCERKVPWENRGKLSARCREIFDGSELHTRNARSDRKCSWLAVQLADSIEVKQGGKKRRRRRLTKEKYREQKNVNAKKKSAGQQENIMVNLLMRGCGYPERKRAKCSAHNEMHGEVNSLQDNLPDEKREIL